MAGYYRAVIMDHVVQTGARQYLGAIHHSWCEWRNMDDPCRCIPIILAKDSVRCIGRYSGSKCCNCSYQLEYSATRCRRADVLLMEEEFLW